jgi:hypothetical protein
MSNLQVLSFQQADKFFLCKRKIEKENNFVGNKTIKEKITIIMSHGEHFDALRYSVNQLLM